MATTALPTEISERDLISVRQLLDDVRTREHAAHLLAASITWLNAFTSFKRTRRRHGLPHDPAKTLFDKESTLFDLIADLLIPRIPAAQLALIEPDLDSGGVERVANGPRRRWVLVRAG